VSEALADQWLPGVDPIGARLLVDDNDAPPRPVEIIGVVGNVQQMALDTDAGWDLYLTYSQVHPDNVGAAAGNMFWILRTQAEPMSLSGDLAREVRRVDAEVVASRIRPMRDYLADAMAPRRFSLSLMTAFACAALALALTGIYAVTAYSISQRTREIGIRLALGATRTNIVRLVVAQGARFIVIGLAGGAGIALAAARVLSTMLFGVAPTDPVTFVQVMLAVAGASMIACAIPAARASRMAAPRLKEY
jgi:putative ABC transport system permease protein